LKQDGSATWKTHPKRDQMAAPRGKLVKKETGRGVIRKDSQKRDKMAAPRGKLVKKEKTTESRGKLVKKETRWQRNEEN
jgi:hypothetical protein